MRQRLGKLVEEYEDDEEDEADEEEGEGEGEAKEAKDVAVSSRFQEYIRQGSIGGRQRQHMMSRVLFTATWSELKYVDMFTSLDPDDIIKLHYRPISSLNKKNIRYRIVSETCLTTHNTYVLKSPCLRTSRMLIRPDAR